MLWDLRNGVDAIPFGYHGVGDFDKDGKPEVVVISSGGPHTLSVIHHNAASPTGVDLIRKGIDINNGTSTATYCGAASEYGGGPPTVADFDGDGKAEVIYSDEYHLWMYDGQTGTNLIPSTCNTTGTLWEYPLVADVDNDGEPDIIVASNAYGITCPDDGSKQSGIRVFGSKTGSWVRTRRVWNEHTYHITNIGEDGKVPAVEPANWTQPGLNDYRQNRQPGSQFGAPDAVVSIEPLCGAPVYTLLATVRNLGEVPLPAGVKVGFYEAMPVPGGTKLGSAVTTKILYPAEAEKVELVLTTPPVEIVNGSVQVYAIVDDGGAPHTWHECRTDNNQSAAVSGKCDGPK